MIPLILLGTTLVLSISTISLSANFVYHKWDFDPDCAISYDDWYDEQMEELEYYREQAAYAKYDEIEYFNRRIDEISERLEEIEEMSDSGFYRDVISRILLFIMFLSIIGFYLYNIYDSSQKFKVLLGVALAAALGFIILLFTCRLDTNVVMLCTFAFAMIIVLGRLADRFRGNNLLQLSTIGMMIILYLHVITSSMLYFDWGFGDEIFWAMY